MLRTLACVMLLWVSAFGQSVAQPTFDVATVKLVPGSQGFPASISMSPRRTGGRLTWTTTRMWLLQYAYHLPSWRITGVQGEPVFYTVEATMDSAATEDQVRLMLRKLLEDRFRMAVHHESKELQGYEMVVARGGSKIKEVPASADAAPMPDYFKGKDSAVFENRILVSAEGKGISALTGRRVSMARLAETLSETLGAFVIDKTGMPGDYYFGFKFLSDPTAVGLDSPSLFVALQEQLGLKLDKQKGPVEILVVDHMEKVPAEN